MRNPQEDERIAEPIGDPKPVGVKRLYEAPAIRLAGNLASVVEASGSPIDMDGFGFRD